MRAPVYLLLAVILLLAGCLDFGETPERTLDALVDVAPAASTAVGYLKTEKAGDIARILGEGQPEGGFLVLEYMTDGIGFIIPYANAPPVMVVDGVGLGILPKLKEKLEGIDTRKTERDPMVPEKKVGGLAIQTIDNRSFLNYGGKLFIGEEQELVQIADAINGGKTAESKFYPVMADLPSGDAEAVFDANVTVGISARIEGNTSHALMLIKPKDLESKEAVKQGVRSMRIDGVNVSSVSELKDLVSVELEVDIPAFVAYVQGRENFSDTLLEGHFNPAA